MNVSLTGRVCTGIRSFRNTLDSADVGPLEIAWCDGGYTSIDVNADWTLNVSDGAWLDPYAKATEEESEKLAREVGLWEPVRDERLVGISGLAVSATTFEANEVGEIQGIKVEFNEIVLVARVFGGDLCSTLERRFDRV